MRRVLPVLLVALAALSAACRSPLGEAPERTETEEEWRVGQGVHIWPLYERAEWGESSRTDVLWPLASVFSGGEGEVRTDILFPLLHYSEDGDDLRYGLRPLFDMEHTKTEDGPETDLDVAWPLFKYKGEPDHDRLSLLWLLPLYERETRPERDSLSVGLLYHRKDSPEESYHWVLPFYGENREKDYVAHWILPPLFRHAEDPGRDLEQWDFLFPLFHVGHEENESSVRALPLYYQRTSPGEVDRVAFPLWWQFDHAEKSSFRMLLPFYGRYTRGRDYQRTIVGGPLFIHTRDGGERSVDVLWPLIRHHTKLDRGSFRLFPLIWYSDEGDEGYTHVWPLFGYDREGEDRRYSTLFPLFTMGTYKDHWRLRFPAPLMKWETHPQGHDAYFFPLFASERTGTKSAGWAAWPLASWKSDEAAGTGEFRILYKFLEVVDGDRKDLFAVNPFFRHERNDQGDVHWSVLFGLLARTREGDRTDWQFLWFF